MEAALARTEWFGPCEKQRSSQSRLCSVASGLSVPFAMGPFAGLWWATVGVALVGVRGQVDEALQKGALGFHAMQSAYTAVRDACIFPNDYEVYQPSSPPVRRRTEGGHGWSC